MQTQPPRSQVPPSSSTNESLLTLTEDQMVINKSKWKYVLEYHEHTSKNTEISALCSFLKDI